MGYTTVADLCAGHPKFFWKAVNPYVSEGLCYLRRTQEGQTWVANLYANVFTAEHEAPAYGPERRAAGDSRVEAESMIKFAELAVNNKRRHRRGSADRITEADSNRVSNHLTLRPIPKLQPSPKKTTRKTGITSVPE